MCNTNKKYIKVDVYSTKFVSFEEILIQFKPLVESIVAGWPTFDKDDLRQICNIGLWKSYEAYDLEKATSFGFFAKKVIIHDVYQFVKKNKPTTVSINSSEDSAQYINNIKDPNKYNDIEDNTTYDLFLEDYIDCLPKKYKTVFKLYFLDNLNQKQIAMQLNYTQPAISYQLKKITTYVKKIYEIDSILSYTPNHIRHFIKKSYILGNVNSCFKDITLNNMIKMVDSIEITIEKVQDTNDVNIKCIQWLKDTCRNLKEHIEIINFNNDITEIIPIYKFIQLNIFNTPDRQELTTLLAM